MGMAYSKKAVFENQNNLRVLNQIKVVDFLKKGPASCVDLAHKLSLSYTAIAKIVDELVNSGILEYLLPLPLEKKKAGRRAALVALNDRVGLIGALDFSSRDILISLSTITNHIVAEGKIEDCDIIDEKALQKATQILETLLSSRPAMGLPLLEICIASPGKIDAEGNYIYAKRIKNYQTLNLQHYFSSHFHVDAKVYHDVRLGSLGERVFGNIPADAQNIYFAYIDNEAGSSFFLDSHLFSGSHNLAGEANDLNPVDLESRESRSGYFYTLSDLRDDIHSRLEKVSEHPLKDKEQLHIKDIADLYQKGDPLVKEAVEESARFNAIQLLMVANLLDVDYLVIQGRILLLGEDYLKALTSYFRAYDKNHNTAKIIFSSLQEKANLLGAIYQGGNLYLLSRFGEMALERTNRDDYDVIRYFGDNI